MDAHKLDQQQLKLADAAERWWSSLSTEQKRGYLKVIEKRYPKHLPEQESATS